jgi:N-acetylmuramoyl-L-alanine amidase
MRATRAAVFAAALAFAFACNRGNAETVLDPANELPFGNVDVPVAKAQTGAQTTVGGWAMDDREIREVRVYVDGRFAEVSKLNTDRPDVSKAFPQYAHATNMHGWTTTIVFEVPGPHTILVQAVDSNGATHDIGTVPVVSLDK